MNAWGGVGASAQPGGDFPAFEVAEELFPFGVGGHPVLLGGPQAAAPGQERQVGLDGLVGIDRLVAESDVDVLVACDDLGDVWRQPVHDRLGDEDPPEIVRGVVQGAAVGGVDQPGAGEGGLEHFAEGAVADRTVLGPETALEQQRGRGHPHAFVPVVGGDEGHCAGGFTDPADDGGQYFGEFGADHQKPLGVGLGGGDLQQWHDLPGSR